MPTPASQAKSYVPPVSNHMSLSKRASNLSPEQISLLVERFKNKTQGVRAPSIPRRPEMAHVPLSFAQQRLWFIEQLDPSSSAYVVPLAFRSKGYLDAGALERAVGEIIRRHEILRTTFKVVDGQPGQIINPAQPVTIPIIDLSELSEDAREAAARLLAAEEARRPFDLQADVMFRALVIRLDAEEQVLLFSLHHIACDGWSYSILVREIGALYRSYSEGRTSPLAELPIQYADFAQWQRQWLDGEILSQQLNYWKEQLTGAAPLELPTDRPRPPVLSYHGAVEKIALERSLVESLRELAQHQGVTLFMLLIAAFKVLLMRYSGQQDISVGTPISGRNRMEIEDLIGFFVNTLVMRTEVRGEESFEELLRRVREVALDGYAHQDVPFEKLVQEIQPERDTSRQPLFQVIFALIADYHQATGKSAGEAKGMALKPFDYDYTSTRYDLELFINDNREGFVARFIYNTDLFDSTTIARMLGHFRNLLAGIVSNPKQAISALPLLSEGERQFILHDLNNTQRDFPSQLCIPQLFEAQVQAAPEATALIFEDTHISYRELNERANLLAHRLRRLGVGPEHRVAVLMERHPQLIVSLLAILKAGGAYLPIDPEYPQERIAFMLADAGVRVVLTQQHLAATVTGDDVEVVCVDTDWASIETEESSANPGNIATAENLAYVIYTSGSTGVPKGVEVTHKNVARLLFGVDYARFEGGPRILHVASVSFDASTFEVWGAPARRRGVLPAPYREPAAQQGVDTRHRAAIGLTEESDAVAIVVSEETGLDPALRSPVKSSAISPPSSSGFRLQSLVLQRRVGSDRRRSTCSNFEADARRHDTAARLAGGGIRGMAYHPFRHLGLKFVSIALAVLLWFIVAGEPIVQRTVRVPLAVRYSSNIPRVCSPISNSRWRWQCRRGGTIRDSWHARPARLS